MERIVKGYMQGTRFGIHMDTDGLIAAGQGLDQVTWMDVRVGEILPTPRHGKPVEINAYWYNALRIMEALGRKAKADGCGPGLRGSGGAGEAFLHGKVLGSRTGLSEGCASRDGCEKGFRGDGERPMHRIRFAATRSGRYPCPSPCWIARRNGRSWKQFLKSFIRRMACGRWKRETGSFIPSTAAPWRNGIWPIIREQYGVPARRLLPGVPESA